MLEERKGYHDDFDSPMLIKKVSRRRAQTICIDETLEECKQFVESNSEE